MSGAPSDGAKQGASTIKWDPLDLPEFAQWLLRFTAGLSILVNIEVLSVFALLIQGMRALLCLPEKGVPLPARFRLAPGAGEQPPSPGGGRASDGGASSDGGADSGDDGASDGQASDDVPAAAAIYIDMPSGAAAKAALARKGAAAPPRADGGVELVEVMHIKVDPNEGSDSKAWQLIGPYMRQFGCGALHSSTLWNPEFVHMFVPGVGSQAYIVGRAYHRTIVVGINDPLAHPDHWPEMAATFSRVFPGATYTHIGPRFAAVLKETQRYTINDAGAETLIQVQRFNYSRRTRTIRNGARDARNAGVAVRELRAGDLTPEVCQQLMAVTGDWLEQKTVKEEGMRVYIRHLDYDNLRLEEGVRLFVAEMAPPEGGPKAAVGFVMLDPLFRGGRVYGYVTSVNRMLRSTHPGVLKLLYDDIMAATKAEGKEVLTFGFSPFFNIQKQPFCGPWWMELSMRFMFHFANNLYGFKMLAFSKARYGGGVVGDAYHDPNVAMGHVYGATWSTPIPDMALLDNYVLMMATGFTGTAMDAFKKLAAWGSSKPKGGDEGEVAASRSASMASAAGLASAASMASTAGSA
ncbi:MAG: hypothetical protein J3K34DRAFT_519108 [Monoraphidium minutum]|nr:MAG: hypothetical protein J3K34DRAFT_519108 [Monoraphidium minutum]